MHKVETVVYNGKLVNKKEFRAYVYGFENKKKLVNHYDEFESMVSTGLWFPKLKDVPVRVNKTARKKDGISMSNKVVLESDEIDALVTKLEDDFLPKN